MDFTENQKGNRIYYQNFPTLQTNMVFLFPTMQSNSLPLINSPTVKFPSLTASPHGVYGSDIWYNYTCTRRNKETNQPQIFSRNDPCCCSQDQRRTSFDRPLSLWRLLLLLLSCSWCQHQFRLVEAKANQQTCLLLCWGQMPKEEQKHHLVENYDLIWNLPLHHLKAPLYVPRLQNFAAAAAFQKKKKHHALNMKILMPMTNTYMQTTFCTLSSFHKHDRVPQRYSSNFKFFFVYLFQKKNKKIKKLTVQDKI